MYFLFSHCIVSVFIFYPLPPEASKKKELAKASSILGLSNLYQL